MNNFSKLSGGLVMATALTASAGTDPGQTNIVGGAPTTDAAAVATILFADANDQIFGLCSGTLVTPDIVLTAAHCVDGRTPVAKFIVYFGTTVLDQDPGFIFATTAKSVAFHPSWNPDQLEAGNDIGVVVLNERPPIAPIPINTAPLAAADKGKPTLLVGWGLTGGGQQDSGVKRAVISQVQDFDNQFVVVGNPQTNTCNGDSGGPAFMDRGGKLVVVGVTSFGDVNCGQIGVDTRVDTQRDFLAAQGIDVGAPPPADPTDPTDPTDPDDPEGPDGLRTPTPEEGGGCNAGAGAGSTATFVLIMGCALLATRRRSNKKEVL